MKPRRFGDRLHHGTPPWVGPGNFFHLCTRVERSQAVPLTDSALAKSLLESARFYHAKGRWWLGLTVLMPDHLHALAAFPNDEDMSAVIGDWKRWHGKRDGVRWQDGYFDHRVREDERGEQLLVQSEYILNNPVRAGLCARAQDWPWTIEHW